MMLKLAWRNLWRNKKRSGIIWSAMVVGLWSGLFASGIMLGMSDSMVRNAIDRDLGHIQFHMPSFTEDELLTQTIPDAHNVLVKLQSKKEMASVTNRILIDAIAASSKTSGVVKLTGLDEIREKEVSTLDRHLIDGNWLNDDLKSPAIVGKKLAEKLGLKLKSKLILSFQGFDGSVVYANFKVAGIIQTQSSVFDETHVWVRGNDLRKLTGRDDFTHEIIVRLNRSEQTDSLEKAWTGEFANLKVQSWKTLVPELKLTADLSAMMMSIFMGIILFALLFGVTNTMLMSVLERYREFGILMAVGMKPARLFQLILIETLILALSAGVFGTAFGLLTVHWFGLHGINLALFADGLASFGISSKLYTTIPPDMVWILALMIISTAIISAIYPGWKATRLKPVEAIRSL